MNIEYTKPGLYDCIYFSTFFNKWEYICLGIKDLDKFDLLLKNNKIYYLKYASGNKSGFSSLIDNLNKSNKEKEESIW
jgi:hypothetical protein